MIKNSLEQRVELVFCDVEGTIFNKALHLDNGKVAPSAWTLLAEALGEEALREEELTKDKWIRGEYSGYIEWMEANINSHQKHGLTKDLFDQVINYYSYYQGVRETFEILHSRGIQTAFISGGFKDLVERAQRDLKIKTAVYACEYFWNKEGRLYHWNLLPYDYEGKLSFMKMAIKDKKIKAENCAFIGDGKNDVILAKEVGISIAFNAQPELEQVCNHIIRQPKGKEDFKTVLQFL